MADETVVDFHAVLTAVWFGFGKRTQLAGTDLKSDFVKSPLALLFFFFLQLGRIF